MICVDCSKDRPNHSEGRCNTCYKRAKYAAPKYSCKKCAVVLKQKAKNPNGWCFACWKPEKDRLYHNANKEKRTEFLNTWRKSNKDKLSGYAKKHYEANKHKYREKDAHRRALEVQATPVWVNRSELREIYAQCPKGHHVDHIVPLKHPLVCGLHVPANLQIIPAAENLRKNNKFNGC